MSASIGALRGLQQCASPSGRFGIVALDHRQNLRRMLRPADPESVSYDELVAFKREAVRALAPSATAVLLDPEVGAAQCIADGSLPGHVGLLVALEATGYVGSPAARISRLLKGWSAGQARAIGASAAKLLVYYHPAASNAAAQEGLVVRAVAACREAELPLFVEPLTYSIGPALEGPERRRVIVETARRMSELGADVLKLQFPYGREETDAGKWREACAEITSSVQRPWVLLSGDNPPDAFVGLADAACAAGASGIACGRGIWTEAPQLTGSAREAFFNSVARARLERLVEVVETRARPWTDAYPRAELDGEDWYKTRS